MGWYERIFGGKAADPLEKLDPKLREFLDKESPVKLQKAQEEKQRREQQQKQADVKAAAAAVQKTESHSSSSTSADKASGVPKESLYQDGRYAHLWKNYRPLSEIEGESKTDHEKLQDVLEAYKSRKEQIGRAALENCALEQFEWRDCMNNGSWEAKLTMCSKQVKKFERCYSMQARLLKTLGYLSTYERPPSVDEDIQMHADALYHRMIEQEEAIEKAKAEKKPLPQFAPLLIKPIIAAEDEKFQLSQEQRKEMNQRLAKIPEAERAMEEEAIKAEYRAKAEVGHKIQDLWKENEKDREKRKKEGQETVLDKVSGMWKGSGGNDK
ncbi:hypothetical protein MGG_03679 [Pyricularia oryzae 70-15]|uniref:Autophagy protein n=3 Tax=Pyricularia oryzae TaxID=318829 RepID=G4N6R8_PYRO7|nr:uncharacterized protein MGG_03679 [Pyricularia oryzae 70-15]EHA49885.1 hypothetical protein MGG_03679 [Pyricularia oryzae 70-15]ELQ38322.1 hypothetical protein OOU_Y34scaffold00542g14 [Pyricularia oryzae Y34]KAI7919102.1 hypothetical protein M9X92_006520 [Pyricularia oryzae]KAI7927185.1 hypothetical protein M0657_003281 [Pyricularia oryzae]